MTENVVRAKKFELVDDYENVYASLEQDQDTGSAALMVYDDDQVPRVGVGINESRTGYVNLRDANGKGGVRVAVEENGSAVVRLRDAQEPDNFTASIATPAEPRRFPALAPVGEQRASTTHAGVPAE